MSIMSPLVSKILRPKKPSDITRYGPACEDNVEYSTPIDDYKCIISLPWRPPAPVPAAVCIITNRAGATTREAEEKKDLGLSEKRHRGKAVGEPQVANCCIL